MHDKPRTTGEFGSRRDACPVVDPTRPHDGITNIVLASEQLAGAHLLGVTGSFCAGAAEIKPVDSYVRASDVVAVYAVPPPADVRIDALWRTASAKLSASVLAVFDLIVSVWTQALDCCPDVSVQSRLAADETLRLVSSSPLAWDTLALSSTPHTLSPETGTGCLLLRVPNSTLTYVEMIHPLDFQVNEVTANEGSKSVQISRRLFRTHLEKGVILRARIRGAFVKRHDDQRTAANCYAAFAVADPPLGT